MRLTDDRYSREQRRIDVALRMIRYEARTCTIRACTGLTEDRVRKLFNHYVEPHTYGSIRRRRGKSPQQITCFTQSAAAQLSASVLAGVLAQSGLLVPFNSRSFADSPSTELGALICSAYEFYCELEVPHRFSFEHAWFLFRSLRNEELEIATCKTCGGFVIHERWTKLQMTCALCRALFGRKHSQATGNKSGGLLSSISRAHTR
jgi:hypothetical protein